MASGSSGRANSGGSKGFDFVSDDVLCSYEDYDNARDSSNGAHSDPVITCSSAKKQDYHKSRMARSSVFKEASYNQQPEDSFSQDMASMVERCMKKHSDNLMRFLEGLSSRLSQLELYCYNLDKSIGEMRADLVHDHGEADSKLKSVEKHLQEVHRSVQVLKDKQELADTQQELVKLQLVQKESSSPSRSQPGEEKAAPPVSDPKTTECTSEMHNNQLALVLPHQVMPQQRPTPVPAPSQAPPQNVDRQQSYYMAPAQLSAPAVQTQHPQQAQYLPPNSQFQTQQIQEISRVAPHHQQPQVNQMPPGQQFPQYQQQWSQQLTQQVQPSQQPSVQPQARPPSTTVYSTYPPPGPGTNPSPPQSHHNSIPVQVSYTAAPQPLSSRVDTLPYGYGAGRPVLQQTPPQQIKSTYGTQTADGYATTTGHHPSLPPGSTYMMYDGEGGRVHIPPQQPLFAQGGYPPQQPHLSLQNSQPAAGSNILPHNPSYSHFIRNHPYSELIEKLVSMGFRSDHVISVIQRMEETGQPVDFNTVLDRLNVHSSGGPQRAWSG